MRDDLLRAFGDHDSASVQQSRCAAWARRCSSATGTSSASRSTLPNRHHLPFDVSRFGLENRNEVFHATTEPYGLIEATIERG